MSGIVEEFGGGEAQFDTRDSRLAAALMAVGVRPVGAEPVRVIVKDHGPRQFQFYFEPVSKCGKYRTRDLLKAWMAGEDWVRNNEDHPFAFAMAALNCQKGILDFVKGAVPYAFMQSGRSVAMLRLDASAEAEREILGEFRQ